MHTILCIMEGTNNVKTPILMRPLEENDECVFVANGPDVKAFLDSLHTPMRLNVCLHSKPTYRTELRRSDWFTTEDKTFHTCTATGFGFWVDRIAEKPCVAFTILKYIYRQITQAHDMIPSTWLDTNPVTRVYPGKHGDVTVRFPDKDIAAYAEAIAEIRSVSLITS